MVATFEASGERAQDWRPRYSIAPSQTAVIVRELEHDGAIKSQRCLVPMAPGYFEWEAQEDGKQPVLIHGPGILAAAGLYTSRLVGDDWVVGFTIITRDAVDAAGRHHDRMPAFLQPEHWGEWLAPGKLDDTDSMLALLEASSTAVAATMDNFAVTRELNNTRTVDREDPALVQPLQER